MNVGWRRRVTPLAPAAAVARGVAAATLASRLLARNDDELLRLVGAAGPGTLAILATSDELPWVDGVAYLGRDPRAPSLLLPTTHETTLPVELFERAIGRRWPDLRPPLGVLHDPPRVCSLEVARPVARATLIAWRAGEAGS